MAIPIDIDALDWQHHIEGVVIGVWAQPGARKNAILGIHNRLLKIAVTAPPEDGRANSAIAELLARRLGSSKSSVELLSGPSQRQKKFLLRGIHGDGLQALIS
jgi:uncharacterized protein (TIGR00251 family)